MTAGRSLGIPRYVDAAVDCAMFVWREMRDSTGRLARAWRGGMSGPAFLDDHALLALGFLTLYETTGNLAWFANARSLIDDIRDRFTDPSGGFFLTAADAEVLIARPKDIVDTAVPSGTSASADALLRLARFTDDHAAEALARASLGPALIGAPQHPTAFGHALCVADMLLGPALEVAIIGDPAMPGTAALAAEVFSRRFLPDAVLAMAAVGSPATRAIPLLAGRTQLDGEPTAYVCERFACKMPTTDPSVLAAQLT